ncbi:activator of Hsp90 ATPase [Chytridium lagenaria]|nr:activator of Hsp90 ATPase [Chytridium lagenaria]
MAAAVSSTNWKNVNNWHWVEKNCFPWANDYIREKMVGATAQDGAIKVEITSVPSVTGDVDINQRKGKLITVYDVAFKLAWKGVDGDGNEANGQIEVPEFMHDTELDEIVFDITTEKGDKNKDAIVKVLRTKLLGELRRAIPSTQMTGHPVNEGYKPKPPAPSQANGKKEAEKVVGSVTTIKQDIEFKCDRPRLFECFLKEEQVKFWSRSNAKISAVSGAEYELFGGNISGKIVEVNAPTKVVMTWRLRSWPQGHFSTVTIDFEELSDATVLHLTQTGVPVGEKETLIGNWNTYYWDSIKRVYGFGAVSLNIV